MGENLRGREVERGREVGERGRELGMGYPPVHPLSTYKSRHRKQRRPNKDKDSTVHTLKDFKTQKSNVY